MFPCFAGSDCTNRVCSGNTVVRQGSTLSHALFNVGSSKAIMCQCTTVHLLIVNHCLRTASVPATVSRISAHCSEHNPWCISLFVMLVLFLCVWCVCVCGGGGGGGEGGGCLEGLACILISHHGWLICSFTHAWSGGDLTDWSNLSHCLLHLPWSANVAIREKSKPDWWWPGQEWGQARLVVARAGVGASQTGGGGNPDW